MVRGRLRSLVNIALVRGGQVPRIRVKALGVGSSMVVRAAALCAGLSAGLCAGFLALSALAAGAAFAEDLSPDQARAFVVGKLFNYTCFEGTVGAGRIFPDGSVVGTIRIRGQGQTRFAALPAGTIRVDSSSMCAHLSGMPFTPCFRVQKLDARSFRGSLSSLGFAYCDFYQRNPRTQLTSNGEEETVVTSTVVTSSIVTRPVEARPLTPIANTRPVETPAVTPVANTRPVLRPSLAE
jgi:hypothetical protein